MKNIILITGGARSGKSRLAESIAAESGLPVTFLATMHERPDDEEQCSRIERHRRRRPAAWTTIDAGEQLPECIRSLAGVPGLVVIDCLSLFVSDFLIRVLADGEISARSVDECERSLTDRLDELVAAMEEKSQWRFVVVTNEVGWGVVPDNALGRAYRDILGFANQKVAEAAHEVWLVCAGQKISLKPVNSSAASC